jgi:hypothetical protein
VLVYWTSKLGSEPEKLAAQESLRDRWEGEAGSRTCGGWSQDEAPLTEVVDNSSRKSKLATASLSLSPYRTKKSSLPMMDTLGMDGGHLSAPRGSLVADAENNIDANFSCQAIIDDVSLRNQSNG